MVIGIVCVSPIIASNYFNGDWVMVVALVVAFAAYTPAHIARGMCSGSGRFRAYAVVMGTDGIVRIVLCLLLAAIGVNADGSVRLRRRPRPTGGRGLRLLQGHLRTEPGPEAAWSEVTPNLGWLLLGSVFAASLLNAGPIATTCSPTRATRPRSPSSPTACSSPASRCSCSRPCRPRCSPGSADWPPSASWTSSATVCGGCCTSCSASASSARSGALAIGPFAIELVYDADLSGRTLAMLALGSALYMVALALAQAIIALKGHALVAAGWSSAWSSFLLATWLSSDDVFRRVEIGLLVSSFASMVACGLCLRHRLAVGASPTAIRCWKRSPTCPSSPERATHRGERLPELLTQTITN